MEKYIDMIKELVVLYAPKLGGAIVVLIIGLFVVKIIMKGLVKVFNKKEMDPSLQGFLKSLIKIILQALLWISVLSMVGVQMTSFIAILGAAGLAIGLALTGTLQNFAGGVMILLFKPFKTGDYLEAQGVSGTIKDIQIFNTIMLTIDNKTVIIPNSNLTNTIITNYSTEPQRRVDWVFGIAYGDNIQTAEDVLNNLINADSRILKDPEHFIALKELADSSVNLVVRAWVKSEDYWGVFFDMNKNVYAEFTKAGINIPFPQMDVHMHQ
ncbi:MAG: mechanosensitive ion channel [Bacteroidota bacterium]|nr:mechanosensitive ion channel [Bacteroidota bacterium]